MASEATKMAVRGNMHIDSKVMEVIFIEHHMPISHSPCRRRSKGPLPSGFNPISNSISFLVISWPNVDGFPKFENF